MQQRLHDDAASVVAADAMHKLATVRRLQARHGRYGAVTRFREAMPMKQRLGDKAGWVDTLLGLAVVYMKQDQLSKALSLLRRAQATKQLPAQDVDIGVATLEKVLAPQSSSRVLWSCMDSTPRVCLLCLAKRPIFR